MADVRFNTGLSFDRGIERIVHEDIARTMLPERGNLAPSEMAQAARLEQLLALPNLADFLERHLQPEVEDNDLLHPARFGRVLEETRQMLRDVAGQNPDLARVLNRAARLLGEEADLRELLQMYRSMLLQG